MVCYCNLRKSNSLQVSTTPLSNLADLNNAVDWIVSTHPIISKSSSPYVNPLVTIPTVTFTFKSIFQLFWEINVYFSLSAFSQFHPVLCRNINFYHSVCSLVFYFDYNVSGHMAKIRRAACNSKSQFFCVSFSRRDSGF